MPYLPQQLRRYMVGPRIIKTGLAIFASEILLAAIGQSQYAGFAATSAVVAVLPSLSGSFNQLKKTLTANLLAAAVAVVVGVTWGPNPLDMTLSAVIVLWALVRLKLSEQAGAVSTTMIWMLSRSPDVIGTYIIGRIGAIAAGTLIGYLINLYVMPPNFLPRIRTGLAEHAEQTAQFGERIAGALSHPEAFPKAEVKKTLKTLRDGLTLIGQQIHWQIDVKTPKAIYLPLEKTKAALFVYVLELARIQEAALSVGGLPPGPVADHVAKTVRAACQNLLGVCLPLVRGEEPDPHSRGAYLQATDELRDLVDQLVDDRATREVGLACFRIYTSIRHTGRRMQICREIYAQGTIDHKNQEGKPDF